MIDFPFLFLARIRLHSYTAFIRERHSARLLHREGAPAAGQPASWSWNRSPSSAAEGTGRAKAGSGAPSPAWPVCSGDRRERSLREEGRKGTIFQYTICWHPTPLPRTLNTQTHPHTTHTHTPHTHSPSHPGLERGKGLGVSSGKAPGNPRRDIRPCLNWNSPGPGHNGESLPF